MNNSDHTIIECESTTEYETWRRFMSSLFTKAEYPVGTLMSKIENGDIGLPDLQRPFIWSNAKVRDLFDSMYKGYPVGNLLLWKEQNQDPRRVIGAGGHQAFPSLLILDGQQRLTSLFAVMKGREVLRDNHRREEIKIAFNPLKESFEVASASTEKNRHFINSISDYFTSTTGNFSFINTFLTDLRQHVVLSPDQEEKIANSLNQLWSLGSYMFTAIELEAGIDEEAAADIFVRINSKGTVLKQADFILTLMSVHWDEGRNQLEKFCFDAKIPSHEVSPYNHFIEPAPEQMLRVVVGYGFRRARLKYVYQILKGKNLTTGEETRENLIQQFDVLRDAQLKALNIQVWHDFLLCLSVAGFRNKSMLSSSNTLLYNYVLFLLGKYEYNVDYYMLQKTIAQWFFMSSITRRYTGSFETAFEQDLTLLASCRNAEEFIAVMQAQCTIQLTPDFWEIKLPNELLTTNTISPAFNAYQAALIIQDANALYSNCKVSRLLDPTVQGYRMMEKHHLFPKAYLDSIGIVEDTRKNQVANLALLWWNDNMSILDSSPSVYVPDLRKRFNSEDYANMNEWHALPEDWEDMEYAEFLVQRRKLMSYMVRDAYHKLIYS